MRYVGGKARIATWVATHIRPLATGKTVYLEPFVGSGANFVKHSGWFQTAIAADGHRDLILMWQAVANGWMPPEHITREEYAALKGAEPSALRGIVGFGASFSGKWFGGYVDTAWDAHWNRYTKPYLAAARASVLKAAAAFKRATILCADYRTHQSINQRTLIYCDPPYAGTLGYGGVDKFDTSEFWKTARLWSDAGAVVVVSETQAPAGWRVLATRERKAMLRVAVDEANNVRQESLFVSENHG